LIVGPVGPILIQDAANDSKYSTFPGIRLGLTRYMGVPICNPAGEVLGTLCLLDGRSEELLGEADLRFLSLLAMRVSAELERERMIEARLAQQRRVQEERQRFITAIVHDLRQPLATARTLLHLAEAQEDRAEQGACLSLLGNRLSAICRMVDELMEYSQLQSGDGAWRSEPVELACLLREHSESFRLEAEMRGVLLTTEVDEALGTCETDPRRLGHIIHNLLSNAVKFAAFAESEERRVMLRAGSVRLSHWKLEVEDTGIGMKRPFLRRLFEEGCRAPETGQAEESVGYPRGRGLGLTIVKGLCAEAGAEIRVRSRPGKGTCFTVIFPRCPPSRPT